jgi:hypothetical protein
MGITHTDETHINYYIVTSNQCSLRPIANHIFEPKIAEDAVFQLTTQFQRRGRVSVITLNEPITTRHYGHHNDAIISMCFVCMCDAHTGTHPLFPPKPRPQGARFLV